MKHVYRYLLTICLCIGAMALVRDAFGYAMPFPIFLLLEVLAVALLYLTLRYWTSVAYYLILEGSLFLLLLISNFFNFSYLAFLESLTGWWVNGFSPDEATYAYTATSLFLALVILSALAFALHKYLFVRILFALANVALLLFLGLREFDISSPPVFFLILYGFLVIYEVLPHAFHFFHTRSHTEPGGGPSTSSVTTHLLPVFFLTVLVTCMIPHSDEPIKWTVAKNIYHGVKDFLESIPSELGEFFDKSSQEYALNMTGYSEEANLGRGGLSDSEAVAFSLQTSSIPKGSLFLNGSIMNVYTGSSWERSAGTKEGEAPPDYTLDAYELLSALTEYASTDQGTTPSQMPYMDYGGLLEWKRLSLTFVSLSTKTVFLPSKTISLSTSGSLPYVNQRDNVLFTKKRKEGTKYYFTYCNPNYYDERFVHFLRTRSLDEGVPPYSPPPSEVPLHSPSPSEGTQPEPSPNEGAQPEPSRGGGTTESPLLTPTPRPRATPNPTPNVHIEELLGQLPQSGLDGLLDERRMRIRKEYLSLPDSLPDRVTTLAEDLTKGLDNDYDRIKALEAYLNKMTYTRTPPVPPEGRDVVDYFLFDAKEGYCTYFASALAIMARCIDLPSRYVQGFTTSFHNRYASFTYHVANSRAHAWAEVYLEGVGWIPFEATAGYEGVRYKEWTPKATAEPKKPADVPFHHTERHEEDEPTETTADNRKRGGRVIFLILVPCLLLLVVGCSFALYIWLRRRQYENRYQAMTTNERFILEFNRILSLLELLGHPLATGETLTQYAERMKPFHPEVRTIASAYLPLRYGGRSAGEDEASMARQLRTALEEDLRQCTNRLKFAIFQLRYLQIRDKKRGVHA